MSRVAVLESRFDAGKTDIADAWAQHQPGYISHNTWHDLREDVTRVVVRVDGDVWQRETGQVIE